MSWRTKNYVSYTVCWNIDEFFGMYGSWLKNRPMLNINKVGIAQGDIDLEMALEEYSKSWETSLSTMCANKGRICINKQLAFQIIYMTLLR